MLIKRVAKRGLTREEEDALHQCVRIVSGRFSSEGRRNMTKHVASLIQRGEWFPVLRPWELALLFYPSEPVREETFLRQIETAIVAGSLTTYGEQNGVSREALCAWIECPSVPASSPLALWLPAWMREGAGEILKKSALVAELEHEWPSIKEDLSEASRNGLNDAAKAEEHGYWFREKAREWARTRGKLRAASSAPAWSGPVHRHRAR